MLSRFSPTLRSTLARRVPLSPASTTALAGSLLLRGRSAPPSPSSSSSLPSSLHRPFQTRGVASEVASAPGSQSVGQAATNVKEEVAGAAAEAAKIIGGNTKYESTEFQSITSDIAQTVPRPVLIWGLAGTVPYAASAALSAWTSRNASMLMETGGEAGSLALLQSLQTFQITYGAVILSFLGAIHWGFEFAKYGGEHGHKRLALGLVPIAAAWPTLYLADPAVALIAQWLGFLASWVSDRWATGQGWTPDWYSQYRFYLTAIAGGSVIFTLFTTEYYSVADAKLFKDHNTSPVKAGLNEAKTMTQKAIDELPVKFEKDPSGGSFGKISKKVSPEEKKAKEEEEKNAKEDAEKQKKEKK